MIISYEDLLHSSPESVCRLARRLGIDPDEYLSYLQLLMDMAIELGPPWDASMTRDGGWRELLYN